MVVVEVLATINNVKEDFLILYIINNKNLCILVAKSVDMVQCDVDISNGLYNYSPNSTV